MKMSRFIIAVFTVMLGSFVQCSDDNDPASVEPRLNTASGQFIEGYFNDTLRITFTFTDGDGDVGLDFDDPQHYRHPYERSFFYLKSTGEKVSSDKLDDGEVSIDDLITYEDRFTPPFDSLPELTSCKYENYSRNGGSIPVYRTENADHWNLEVRFFVEESPGNFVRRVWPDVICGPFYGLIPTQSNPVFTVRKIDQGKTEVVYSSARTIWRDLFNDARLQVEIQIKDRALHVSESMRTQPFESL